MPVSRANPVQNDSSYTAFATASSRQGEVRPSIDRVVRLMPGFVYVFSHVTYSNDYTNRSVGEHLGYSSQEIRDFGDRMLMHVVHPDDNAAIGAHMAAIAALADDESATLEYRVFTKQGDLRWLRSVDTVFDRAADGTVLRHIGCASDITAEKCAELQLEEMNQHLEQEVMRRTRELAVLNVELEERIAHRTAELQDAVDELEQLTYIATHDLKVPVNNLARLGLMLGEAADNLTEDQAEQVRWITECTRQLDAKIQGLVLVAQIRLEAGLPIETCNLRAIAQDIVASLSGFSGLDILPIRIDIPDHLRVHFARVELEWILSVTLDNALKYCDPDRPVQIKLHADDLGETVLLRVSDNGSGLDAARDAEAVFGLFQRAHKTPPGSGISLYCARRMLLRQGGAMTVSGQRGIGAEFTMIFPAKGVTE